MHDMYRKQAERFCYNDILNFRHSLNGLDHDVHSQRQVDCITIQQLEIYVPYPDYEDLHLSGTTNERSVKKTTIHSSLQLLYHEKDSISAILV